MMGTHFMFYCVLEQDAFLPESTGDTKEAVAPSRH